MLKRATDPTTKLQLRSALGAHRGLVAGALAQHGTRCLHSPTHDSLSRSQHGHNGNPGNTCPTQLSGEQEGDRVGTGLVQTHCSSSQMFLILGWLDPHLWSPQVGKPDYAANGKWVLKTINNVNV